MTTERLMLRRPGSLAVYLGLVMGMGPLLHNALSSMGPLIVADLELSATEFGLLWFVMFAAACVFTLAGGKLTDRFGARMLMCGVFVFAAVSMLVAGLAGSYAWLVVALVLSGIAQAVSNPATNSSVARSVAPERQGVVMGIKQSGVQVSQFVAGLALPSLALLIGWRAAVLTCIVVAVAGVVITLVGLPQEPRSSERGEAPRSALDVSVRWMTAYAFLMGMITQLTNVYLPLYAHQELGLPVTQAGLIAAVLGGVGVVARLTWGRFSDRFSDMRRPLIALALLAAAAMFAVLMATTGGQWLIWLGACLFSIGVLSANVIIMVTIVRFIGRADVGRASGWVSTGLYTGFMMGPLIFGVLVDAAGYSAAWTTAMCLGLVLAVMTVVWQRTTPATVRSDDAARPA